MEIGMILYYFHDRVPQCVSRETMRPMRETERPRTTIQYRVRFYYVVVLPPVSEKDYSNRNFSKTTGLHGGEHLFLRPQNRVL